MELLKTSMGNQDSPGQAVELLKMVFASNDVVGQTVNYIILFLFAVGVLDVLSALFRLFIEKVAVLRARRHLAKIDTSDEEAVSALRSPQKVLRSLEVPRWTQFGKRIRLSMELRGAGLGSRDVLQQLTTEHLGAYGALARQIGTTLTLLGLLGTVFGLSLALLSIGDASIGIKGIDDLSKLSKALAGTMGGMKTAFGCTLAGLMGAVLMSFLNHGCRRSQSKVTRAIEEFLLCDLLPKIEIVDPDADAAAKAFASVLHSVSDQLTGLTEKMAAAADNYVAGSTAVQETLSELDDSVSSFSTVMAEVSNGQKTLHDSVRVYQDEFRKLVGESRQSIADAVRTALEDTMARMGESISKASTTMEGVSSGQESLKKSMEFHREEFKKLVGEMQQTFEKALSAAVEKQAQESMKELGSLLQGHSSGMKSVMQSVSDLVWDIHQLNGRANQERGTREDTIAHA